jgi:hypothetical protein
VGNVDLFSALVSVGAVAAVSLPLGLASRFVFIREQLVF